MLYKKITLSLEGQADETKLIVETMKIISALKSTLTVIHVNDPDAGKASMMMDTLPRITRQDLIEMFHRSGFDNQIDDILFKTVDDQSYTDAIAELTENADLLIMGHHQRNKFMSVLLTSTDEFVSDQVKCPILLLPLS
ncbi:universal stress protein [bacterium]|nr:universal stress protein [candidate division CSSED10-310 bacterium]